MAYANVHGAAPSAYPYPAQPALGPGPSRHGHPPAAYAPPPYPGPHGHAPMAPAPRTAAEARRLGALVGAAGAILSVLLVAGVGWWSYRLMVRDVSGIPVVRALEGPMRVAAADPGGRQAAFQGLAVNSVPASGGATARPATIALAPAPIDLAPEDRLRLAAPAPAPVAPPASTSDAVALALAAAMQAPVADAGPLPAGTPGVTRSPVPPARPGSLAARAPAGGALGGIVAPSVLAAATGGTGDRAAETALAEIATRLAAPRVTEINPASLTPGTRLVQLGAYETEGEARRAWEEFAARFPAYLDGRGRVIEPATAGGRVFFRLRAHGFRDEPEARRFCSVFVTEDLECTPVLIR